MKVLLLRQKVESQKKFCETLKNAGDEVVHLNEDIFSNNYNSYINNKNDKFLKT